MRASFTPSTLPGRLARSLAPLVAALLVACGVPESALDLNGWPTLGPPPPPAVSATVGDATVTVAWESVEGAIGYHLYYSDTAPVTLGSTRLEDVTPPVTLNGLQNGATYYVAASARNAAGESALSSMVEVTPVAASAAPPPPGEVVVEPGDGTAVVSWAVVADASGYNLYYVEDTTGVPPDDGAAFDVRVEGVASPYTVSGLSNGVTYHFAVTSVNTAGESPFTAVATSAPVAAVEPPPTPTGLVGTVGDGQVALTWTPVAGASGYRVFYSDVPPATVEDPMVAATSSNATVTGLTNGTSYYMGVQAWNSAGTSEISDRVVVTPVPVPGGVGGVTVEGGDGQVLLNWSAVPFASDYVVYYGKTSPVTTSSSAVPSSLTERVVQGLDNDDTYYFRVAARNATGTGELSDEVWATPTVPLVPPGPPQNVMAAVGDGQATISWSSVASATSYRVYYSTSAMVTTDDAFVDSSGSPQIVAPLTNHQTYNFAVQARNSAGEGALSAQVSTTPIPVPPQPAPPTLHSGDGRLTATWSPVSGATSYVLYYSSTSPVTTGSNKIEGAVSEQEVLGLVNGTTYYFALAGRNAAGEGPLSAEASRAPIAVPGKPGGVTATARDGHVIVDWSPSTGADEYFVFVSTSSPVSPTSYQQAFQADAGPASIGPVTNGTPYYFVVVGRNASGDGPASDEVSATPMPSPGIPGDFNADAGDAEVTLTWALDAAAEDYAVYWGTTSPVGMGHPFIEVDAPPLVVPLLDNGTTYYFKVVARNAYGESVLSPQRAATPRGVPAVPQGLVAVANGTAIDVAWAPAADADTFWLYYSTTSPVTASDSRVAVSDTAHRFTTLGTSSTWYFAVAGVNPVWFEGGDLSGTVGVTPGVPQNVGTVVDDQRLYVHWDSVPFATDYDVYYGTEPITSKFDGTLVSTTSLPAVLEGLENDTTYYIRVAARNGWSESDLSDGAEGTPRYDGPIVYGVHPVEVRAGDNPTLELRGARFSTDGGMTVEVGGQSAVVGVQSTSFAWASPVSPPGHGWSDVHVQSAEGGRTSEAAVVYTAYPGAAHRDLPGLPRVVGIAGGDFDGDGRHDLVVATDGTPRSVVVVFGDGRGGERERHTLATYTGTIRDVAVGDLDGDGHRDILIARSGALDVYFGDGAGGFDEVVTESDGSPWRLAVGPFLSQGRDEVAVSHSTAPRFTLVGTSGDRSLRVVSDVLVDEGEGVSTTSIAAGRFQSQQHGGSLGVAIVRQPSTGSDARIRVYHGDGQGGFSFVSQMDVTTVLDVEIAAAHIRSQERADIVSVTSTNLRLHYLGGGPANYNWSTSTLPPVGHNSGKPALVDVSGDGFLDIVVPSANQGELFVLINNRSVSDWPRARRGVRYGTKALYVADLDGDGLKDLVSGSGSTWADGVRVDLGAGSVAYGLDEFAAAGNVLYTYGDLGYIELNGAPMVVSGSRDSTFRLWPVESRGLGVPLLYTQMPAEQVVAFAVGDIDGDSNAEPDLVIGMRDPVGSSYLRVYRQVNGQLNNSPTQITLPSAAGMIATGTLDADQHLDVAVSLPEDGVIRVYRGRSGGITSGDYVNVFGGTAVGSAPLWGRHVAIADLDGDEHAELLVLDEVEGGLWVHWGDQTDWFAGGPYDPDWYEVCDKPQRMAFGDFGGQGAADVAITCGDRGDVVVLTMLKNDLITSHTIHVGDFPLGIVSTDVDGDGRDDLVVTDHRRGRMAYLRRDDGFGFDPPVYFAGAGQPVGVVALEPWVLDGERPGLATISSNPTSIVSLVRPLE